MRAHLPKPTGLGPAYAAQFADPAVVAAYPHRPPYPTEVFTLLQRLLDGRPAVVLDLGCGTGDLARPLAPLVERVDGVDCSAGMLELGKRLAGGDHPHLHWILGSTEELTVAPASYGLVTAAESLHWMDWDRVLPSIAEWLVPDGVLALLGRKEHSPWWEELQAPIQQYTTNADYQPYDLVAELEQRGLFHMDGSATTQAMRVRQPLASHIESIHSRNGFSRDRMTPDAAEGFDREVKRLLAGYAQAGSVEFDVVGHVAWGRPLSPS